MDPILSRRDVRKYLKKSVPKEDIMQLLKAAMAAPSAEDERPWHFIVIDDDKTKNQISKTHSTFYIVAQSPSIIVVCGDEGLQKVHGFWVQDCSAATENAIIEAQYLGLGAVWLGIYPIKGRIQTIRQLLNIPTNIIPFSLLTIGYPAENKTLINYFDMSRVHFGNW